VESDGHRKKEPPNGAEHPSAPRRSIAGRLMPTLGGTRLARSSDERGRRRRPPSVSLSAINDTFVQ
jgi:hypothetical protein